MTDFDHIFLWISDIQTLEGLENCMLNCISVHCNEITDLRPLSNMTSLRELNVTCNNIQDISPISNLINLKVLRLGRNPITNLDPIRYLVNLEELDLSGTLVKNLDAISNLRNLKILRINDTNICSIQPIIHLLLQIETLDCTGCPIIEEEQALLFKLKTFNVEVRRWPENCLRF